MPGALHFVPHDLRAWTRALAKQYGIAAGKRLGQHFLVDRSVLEDIILATELGPGAKVLEVGGGFGVLTLALLEKAARVAVVELDDSLAKGLRKLGFDDKLTVLCADILRVADRDMAQALQLAAGESYTIAANLPYEISGAFLRRFLAGSLKPQAMVLLLQYEVAYRLAAKPGQGSLLSLAAQLYSRVEVLRSVPPQAFWPAPKVNSALVRLKLIPSSELVENLPSPDLEKRLWQLARIGFASRRKFLRNNLLSVFKHHAKEVDGIMRQAGLKENARAQELSAAQWVALARAAEGSALPSTEA